MIRRPLETKFSPRDRYRRDELHNSFPFQLAVFDYRGVNLSVCVADVELVNIESLQKGVAASGGKAPSSSNLSPQASRGVLLHQTVINFIKAPDSTIRLKGSR